MLYINWQPSRVCAVCATVILIAGCSTYQQHLANVFIGKNVDEVYARIGRPASVTQELMFADAEDGQIQYGC